MRGQKITHVVRQGLGVRSRARAAAVDVMVQRRELVTDTVGDVGPRGGTRVGAEDYAAVELHGHDGGLDEEEEGGAREGEGGGEEAEEERRGQGGDEVNKNLPP